MTRRLCLVTGASAGIGQAFARIFASHGYDVALTARRADRLEHLAEEIRLRYGVETLAVPADLADPAACDHLLQTLAANGREVDALVNNAGYGLGGAYAATSWDDERAFLQVLLVAVCELTHKVLPGMVERRFGRIVNVASLAGPRARAARRHPLRRDQVVPGQDSPKACTWRRESRACTSARSAPATPTPSSMTSTAPASRCRGGRRSGSGWGPTRWRRPATRRSRPTGSICVPGAPNKAVAALTRIVPEDWALALIAREQRRTGRL